jgi:hypothetical protein
MRNKGNKGDRALSNQNKVSVASEKIVFKQL